MYIDGIYRQNNRTAARTIILRRNRYTMKTYLVTLKIGDFRTTAESAPTTIRELWYIGLHLLRLMKRNGTYGRFIVRSYETGKTIFCLYTKRYDLEYKVRLANIGYAKSCGGYTF